MQDPKELMKEEIHLQCDCGCSTLEFTQWLDDGDIFIGHKARSFDILQNGIFRTIWHRVKTAFNILVGKEYWFFDIIITKRSDIIKLKNFVNNLREDILPYD